jgi:hypothetical protein
MVTLMTLGPVGSASAGLDWRPEQTVELVRGIPEPDVAVSGDGRAALLFSSADFGSRPRLELWVRRANMPEPFIPGAATSPGGATDGRVVMSPSGVTAVAALEAGRLFVTMYPAAPEDRYRGKVVEIEAPGVADEPQIGIDASGRATIAWASPPRMNTYLQDRPRQVHAVTVGPDAVAAPVQALGEPGACDPALDVNLRGDAVVAVSCAGRDPTIFHRPAAGSFDAGQRPFAGAAGTAQVGIDGQGGIHAIQTSRVTVHHGKYPDFEYRLAYSVRPPGGSFSQPEAIARPGGTVGPLDLVVQESGRAIAGWVDDGRFLYAVRASSGSFGPAKAAGDAHAAVRDDDVSSGADVVASHNGPVMLVWREAVSFSTARVAAAKLRADGGLTNVFRGIPGRFSLLPWSPAFAVNDSGQVAGAWEQRCAIPDGAIAVMAVQRDIGGTPKAPPCQDRAAPRALVWPKRARLNGRKLRVRVNFDETSWVGIKARVLRGGRGKPLATARTRRAQKVAFRRHRSIALRLKPAQAKRVRAALAARRRVTVRLALSVRDRYRNRAVRRVAVPLRR